MTTSFTRLACLASLVSALGWHAAGSAEPIDERQIWSAGSGHMELEIRGDYLPDFGIEILHNGQPIKTRKRLRFPVSEIEPFRLEVPWGNLESLRQDRGRLAAQTGLVFQRGDHVVTLDRIELRPGEGKGHPQFIAVSPAGNELFRLTHMHMLVHPESNLLTVANAEVEASTYLAQQLALPELDGMPLALGWLDLLLAIPNGANTSGQAPGCEERPIWPQDGQFEADVTLIDMGTVAYQGTQAGTGLVKTAPSATLKNESLADIPWIEQFETHPDYSSVPADQHPFLVWNIYRVENGRIRMLAKSGVKHAFFTVNQQCDLNCFDGRILWPGCEDTYASGSNDTSKYQGPQEEIEASIGTWESCGSFFDPLDPEDPDYPECDGNQSGYSGHWLNRLLIDPAEFESSRGGTLYMDAWYVIQYDVNIWNGMGYLPIEPEEIMSGWDMNAGTYTQGPVISEWVPEDNTDPVADHDVIVVPSETPDAAYPDNMPQGHLRLLVKVHETSPGRYRYNYALQNYDFDRKLDGLKIAIPSGAEIYDAYFGDIDQDPSNDWVTTIGNGFVAFEARDGNRLGWFTLFNFEIETDAAPVDSLIRLDLGNTAVQSELSVETLGPASGTELLFQDRFLNAH